MPNLLDGGCIHQLRPSHAGGIREGIWHWFWQMTAWIIILNLVKVIICIFMWLCSTPLAWMGSVLFAPLQNNIRFELLFVMIFFPGVLNIVYFWITDSYLKAGKEHAGAHNDEEKEMHPVNVGESVTPYSQMETTGDDLSGQNSSVKGGVTSYGSTPDLAGQSNTLV